MEQGISFRSPEEEIKYLEQKILEKKRALESGDMHDIARTTIEEHVGKESPQPAPGMVPLPSNHTAGDARTKEHVAALVEIALTQGVSEAVKRARESHNPYLIDAFHDALADTFLESLRSKGLLVHG